MSHLDIVKNSNRTPGYQTVMYVIEKDDIETFPATDAGKNEISTAFVPKTGAAFKVIPISNETGKAVYTTESGGTADNPARNATLSVYHPGYDPTTSYELDQYEGLEVIVLIGQRKCASAAGDPQLQILGDKCAGAKIRSTYTDGNTDKGFTIVVTETAVTNPVIYTAAVPV